MKTAVDVFKVILKFGVSNITENELGKELAAVFTENGIDKIENSIIQGRSQIECVLSRENLKSMNISEEYIDFIIAEIKELLSKIEITGEIFRQCKYDGSNLEDFLWKEYSENKNSYIEYENEIKGVLFAIAEVLIKLKQESEEYEKEVLIHISNTVDDIKIESCTNYQNLAKEMDKLNTSNRKILDKISENPVIKVKKKRIIQSRTKEYADKWDANMFLNDFDEWDENAGVNIKLSDVYLDDHLPHFIYEKNANESKELKKFLIQYIEKSNENKMLLILGQPGIGKSTLITWITANFESRLDDILVYQFASDFKDIEWESHNISERILNDLGLSSGDLNGKVLILDGYDEINVRSDRKEILDWLYWNLVKNNTIKNFSLIVTCRVNYIEKFERVKCRYITLQPWNEEQIKSFCNIFQLKTKNDISENTIENMLINKEILGVPLILYMVLALNISVNSEGSIVDIYDKIFSLDGGIYDRCINNKSFAEIHRIGHIKEQVHQISREIALWMFENNPDKACIPQNEYRNICDDLKNNMKENEDIERDFMIGNFFKLKHCEGEDGEELYFVHRSIYEYFVVEYIFKSICNVIDLSKEELAGVLGRFLKGNILTQTMLEYLKIKILNSKLKKKFHVIDTALQLMLKDGMTYYTKIYYKNVINCELNVFANMLEILHLWENERIKINELFCRYLKYNKKSNLNLKKAINDNIKGESQCEKINLSKGAFLEDVYLRAASLDGANLRYAYLKDADLRDAHMCFADLSRANLSGANLSNANLIQADLSYANLKDANLMNTILEASRWTRSNLSKALLQIRNSNFDYIIVEDQEQKKVYKEDLFPKEE